MAASVLNVARDAEDAHATGEVDQSKFNVLGGSIAYGHPFAATGANDNPDFARAASPRRRFCLVTACAAGGPRSNGSGG